MVGQCAGPEVRLGNMLGLKYGWAMCRVCSMAGQCAGSVVWLGNVQGL